MNFRNNNLIIGALVLLSFISIGVFGLLPWNHASHLAGAPMVNCPYSENSYSMCENVLDHIAKWQRFSDVVISPFFLFSFLVLGLVLYLFHWLDFLNRRFYYRWKYYLFNKDLFTYSDKITKWLSLFENSPSFSYARRR